MNVSIKLVEQGPEPLGTSWRFHLTISDEYGIVTTDQITSLAVNLLSEWTERGPLYSLCQFIGKTSDKEYGLLIGGVFIG